MQLWLYDDATRYSQLLVVGELVALYCPVVRALPQQSEEQPVQWVLEVASGTLVSVKVRIAWQVCIAVASMAC